MWIGALRSNTTRSTTKNSNKINKIMIKCDLTVLQQHLTFLIKVAFFKIKIRHILQIEWITADDRQMEIT